MLILTCDTSNSTCCAGLYEEDKELAYEISLEKRTHSETFMPLVERVMKASGKSWQDIDAIASTVGPGSFTGIRIGLSAVKGMSLSLNKPCISVSSTKALAASVEPDKSLREIYLIPAFDARNKRVFASCYKASDLSEVVAEGAYAVSDFIDLVSGNEDIVSGKIIVLGDGAPVINEAIDSGFPPCFFDVDYAPGAIITPKGISKAAKDQPLISGAEITASYCAVSQAERLRKN